MAFSILEGESKQPGSTSSGAGEMADEWLAVRRLWPVFKRAIDVVLGSAMLLAVLPLMMCIAVAIKLDSPGPVFYGVRRVGYRGRHFVMLKFRKMHDGAAGLPLTQAEDPRLTRVGAILTRTRLDELPQLWDVVRGRMSLIGPRPEDPWFVEAYRSEFERILLVRPGMTGITQLAFAAEAQILDARDPVADYRNRILPQKLALDMLYTRTSGLLLDLSVILWTVVAVLFGCPIAVDRSTARMRIRRQPTCISEPVVRGAVELRDGLATAASTETTTRVA